MESTTSPQTADVHQRPHRGLGRSRLRHVAVALVVAMARTSRTSGRRLDRADAYNRRRVEADAASDRRQQERRVPVTDPDGRTWHVSAEFITAATFGAGWLPFPLDWATWEAIGRRRGEGRVTARADDGEMRTVQVREVAQLEAAQGDVRTLLSEGQPLPARIGWTA